ncbi:hypothetical protein [Clostridium sp. DMHC 10]|nr:hypothetical protein [Clostridium sp. DMHC 10]
MGISIVSKKIKELNNGGSSFVEKEGENPIGDILLLFYIFT